MLKKVLKIGIVPLLLAGSTGCGSRIVLHPLAPEDIFDMPVGAMVVHGKDSTVVTKPGWFLSDDYMKEVMNCRISK